MRLTSGKATETTIRYGCSPVNLERAKLSSLRAFVPYVRSAFLFLLELCTLIFYMPMCLHFFIKYGATHNQQQQAGISKNEEQ